MRFRLIRALDTLAHKLHIRWRWICDRYDLALGVLPNELHRAMADPAPSVPLDEILGRYADELNLTDAEFESRAAGGEPVEIVNHPVAGYRCQHFQLTYGNAMPLGAPTVGCGCTMVPVYR